MTFRSSFHTSLVRTLALGLLCSTLAPGVASAQFKGAVTTKQSYLQSLVSRLKIVAPEPEPEPPRVQSLVVRPSRDMRSCRDRVYRGETGPWYCLEWMRTETTVTGEPTHYRVSDDPGFAGATWRPYQRNGFVRLSRTLSSSKRKTIYFQVRKPKEATGSISSNQAPPKVAVPGAPLTLSPDLLDRWLYSPVRATVATLPVIAVASMGDSFGSGEGSPNFGTIGAAQWESEQCHRSNTNSRALAVERLREALPETLVLFGDVACSGATIREGFLGGFTGAEGGPRLDPQVDQVQDWLEGLGMSLDVLLMQVGGNDIGFSRVIEKCINPLVTAGCDQDDELAGWIADGDDETPKLVGFAGLQDSYAELNDAIEARSRLRTARVVITEYPDLTRDEDGLFGGCPDCHPEEANITGEHMVNEPSAPTAPIGASMSDIQRHETSWVYAEVLTPLNRAVRDAASRHGWDRVGGIEDATRRHGLFAPRSERFFNTLVDSFENQGDFYGSFHPNTAGYAAISEEIFQALDFLY